jgi:hypothetical protein
MSSLALCLAASQNDRYSDGMGLEKAEEFLSCAAVLGRGMVQSAVNRAYYAMFQAAERLSGVGFIVLGGVTEAFRQHFRPNWCNVGNSIRPLSYGI